MKKWKKIVLGCCIALVVLAILLIGIWRISIGLYISTLENSPEKLLKYEENVDGTLTITDVKGMYLFDIFALEDDCYEIKIPEKIDGMTVTIIGEGAFWGCHNMVEVDFSDRITTIGDRAFEECYNLKTISFPDSVTTIGDYAFLLCTSLEKISLPRSVSSMGQGVFFHNNNLRGVVRLPEGMTTIDDGFICALGWHVPKGTYTIEIWIPNTVTEIDGSWAQKISKGTRCIYYAEKGSYAANWLKALEEHILMDFFSDEDYKEAIVIY